MQIGLSEIIVIIVVIIVTVLLLRIFRTSRQAPAPDEQHTAETLAGRAGKKSGAARGRINRAGITLVLIGAVILFVGIVMFRWAYQSYMWSFAVIALGLVLLLLSRRK